MFQGGVLLIYFFGDLDKDIVIIFVVVIVIVAGAQVDVASLLGSGRFAARICCLARSLS